jgi:hypothetical protein
MCAGSCAIAQTGDEPTGGPAPLPCAAKEDCPGELACVSGRCGLCACGENEVCLLDTGECIGEGGVECAEECLDGSICSVLGECIDAGSCLDDGDCVDEGFVCNTTSQACVPGSSCTDGEIPTKLLGPNLMILFDRTASMANEMPDVMQTRIEVARKAAGAVLTAYEGKVRFGISLFSACKAGGCSPGIVNDPLGSETSTMKLTLEGATPCQSGVVETSLAATMQAFVGYAPLQAEGRDNAIVFFADDGEQCMGDPVAVAKALIGQPIPVPVYAIGFTAGADEAQLASIAEAAGTSPYAQVETEAELSSALDAVAKRLKSCAYDLAYAPKSSDLYVFFNDDAEAIPEDGVNGWTLDTTKNALIFHGMACELIKNGGVADVDLVEGCSGPTPD